MLELGSKIQSQVQSEVGKNQREYFLREQMKAIQKELGEGDDQTKEIEELAEKIEAAGMPEAVKKEALRELDRLSKMPAAAAEYTVSRTYLDWLVALPWAKRTDEVIDLPQTKSVLDADHSGLEKVKDRILEYLAVRKLNPDVKGPILCFVGPPGVGKTSLARSIARVARAASSCACRSAACATRPRSAATAGPTSARCPGRSSRACAAPSRRTRSSSSTRSTSSAPTSAAIRRRRCSRCSTRSRTTRSAITTSTCRSISRRCCSSPPPTCSTRSRRRCATAWRCSRSPATPRKRSSQIATDHLVAKQVKNHGLTPEYIRFTPDALRQVIRGYTREAGVRNLEREIGALCRKAARRRAEGDEDADRRSRPKSSSRCSARRGSSTRKWRSAPRSRAWPSASPGRRSAARCCSSRRRAWPAPAR